MAWTGMGLFWHNQSEMAGRLVVASQLEKLRRAEGDASLHHQEFTFTGRRGKEKATTSWDGFFLLAHITSSLGTTDGLG